MGLLKEKEMKLFSLVSIASASHDYYPNGVYTTSPYDTTTTEPRTTSATSATTTGEPFRECGGTITGYETIASPVEYGETWDGSGKWGYFYPHNVQCVWNIELGDHVPGFNIVNISFDVEGDYLCEFDWVRVTANDVEENFCGEADRGNRRTANKEKKEGGKYTPDQVNPINTGFPAIKFIEGGSAVIRMHSDNTVRYGGFEFEIVKLTRWEIINFYVDKVSESVKDESWGPRYESRMAKILGKLGAAPEDGVSCYDENFPQDGEEGDEITVFDADNMCKLNGQVNSAINSYARHNACKGRGKVYR